MKLKVEEALDRQRPESSIRRSAQAAGERNAWRHLVQSGRALVIASTNDRFSEAVPLG